MNSFEPLRSAKNLVLLAGLVFASLVLASAASAQQPITYQGQLKQSGTPFTGMADLEFRLYDSLSGGTQIGSMLARADWPVEEGLFQVELDFGAGSFGADPRWLQITVDGSTLVPRQRVHAAPMAMFALAGNEGPPGPAGPAGPTGPAGDSHWIINGTATGYLDGRVGVGTVAPAGALDVHGNSSIGFPQLRLFETQDDYARFTFANAVSDRFWSLAGLTRGADPLEDRFNLFHSVSGDVLSVRGSGEVGVGFNTPPSALAVRSKDAWTWTSGTGRGDFHVGDGSVGLSMGVALGGGGRGVSRIWTNGGVENLYIGSAGYGVSLGILPGQVGVNTTNPQATLDVDGDLRVRALADGGAPAERPVVVDPSGNLLAAAPPVLRRVAISDAAFKPHDSTAGYRHGSSLYRGETGTAVPAYAHVQVPDGAKMQTIRAYILDNSATKNLQVFLWRGSPSTNFSITVAEIVSSGVGIGLNYREFTDLDTGPAYDASNPLVLYVRPLQDGTTTPTTWDADLGISAVIIEYTPPTP